MIKIDLHSHSTCSDGTFSPTELVLLAHKAGVDVFALTDHDTISGINEAKKTAQNLGIKLIHGVEISCHHTLEGGYGVNQSTSKSIHVVALNFNDTVTMQNRLHALQISRETRGQQIVKNLGDILAKENKWMDKFNIDNGGFDNMDCDTTKIAKVIENTIWQAVLTKAKGNAKAVGRAHIGQVLYEIGVVKSIQDAFDKYLSDNKPAYVAMDSLSIKEAIDLIHQCDGVAVLAHPTRYKLSATRVRRLVADFAGFGGDGCELPPVSEPVSTRAMIDRCVALHGLKVSVGSDFHGSTMPWRRLGEVSKPKAGQVGIWEDF